MSHKQIPTAQHHNEEAFQGEWKVSNDWTIINQDNSVVGGNHKMLAVWGMSAVFDKIASQIATFCRFAKRMWIDPHPIGGRVPTIFLKLDKDDLKGDIAGHNVVIIEVADENGKIARAALTLFNSDISGWRARLTCQRRNDDPNCERKMTFVDWEK